MKETNNARIWDTIYAHLKLQTTEKTAEYKVSVLKTLFYFLRSLDPKLQHDVLLWDENTFKNFLKTVPGIDNEIPSYQTGFSIIKSLRDRFVWNEKAWIVGRESNLSAILTEAGIAPSDAAQLVMAVNYIKVKALGSKDPLVRAVAHSLEQHGEKLVYCLLGGSCSIDRNIFAAYAFNANAEGLVKLRVVRNLEKLGEIGEIVDPLSIPIHGIKRMMNVVVMPMPGRLNGNVDVMQWVQAHFHESTHYLDTVFISQWIRANVGMSAKGKKPDEFFTRYVRFIKNGPSNYTITVDNNFYSFFIETRAYASMKFVLEALSQGSNFNGISQNRLINELTDLFINQVRVETDFSRVTSDWGIESSLDFEKATNVVAKMAETMATSVDQARLLYGTTEFPPTN